MTLDRFGLEHAIVRHCSPTLAGIKPGCLFNVPGSFSPSPACERGRALDALVARENEALAPSGVRVRVLARRSCGALVFVYRPELLGSHLREARVAELLRGWGYATNGPGWLEGVLAQLGARLQAQACSGEFPHEVGLFLGYPTDDVVAFIEHEGRDYLCCGCWKVYSHPERAQACFASYRRCTQACLALLETGSTVADLASGHVSIAA